MQSGDDCNRLVFGASELLALTLDDQTVGVRTAAELAVAIEVIGPAKHRKLIDLNGDRFRRVIHTAKDLRAILMLVEPADQSTLLEWLGSTLREIIRSAEDLNGLLATLSDSTVEQRLVELLGSRYLAELIGSAEDLALALEWIYGQGDDLVLKLLGPDHLRRVIRGGYGLSLVLRTLEPAEQQGLLEQLGWDFLVDLRMERDGFCRLMRAIPGALGLELLRRLPDESVVALGRRPADRAELRRFLEPAEYELLLQRLDNA